MFDSITVENNEENFLLNIFESQTWIKKVFVDSSIFKYILVCDNSDLDFELKVWNDASVEIQILLLWYANTTNSCKLNCVVTGANSSLHIQCVSLLDTWTNCSLLWGIKINKWLKKINAKLDEKNVVLWENVQMHIQPKLDVLSDDVVASHSAKIDRLDQGKLFYMNSKWISFDIAKWLMIDWYINSIFDPFLKQENTKKLTDFVSLIKNKF